jgi:hypothetical protein
MCGIFGIIAKEGSTWTPAVLLKALRKIAVLSESRGKDSSGLCFRSASLGKNLILKGDIPVSELIRKEEFTDFLKKSISFSNGVLNHSFCVIGHARLVTNGTQLNPENNQPVYKDGIVGVHNGIIVNNDELWTNNDDLIRTYEIDTEVMLSIVRKDISAGYNIESAVSRANFSILGTVSTAMLFEERNDIVMSTNNGALYILTNYKDMLCFASESHILKKIYASGGLKKQSGDGFYIKQVPSNSGYYLGLDDFKINAFDFKDKLRCPEIADKEKLLNPKIYDTQIKVFDSAKHHRSVLVDIEAINKNNEFKHMHDDLEYPWDQLSRLKRCTKCILPETFPFIEFDEHGVCNYCKNYKIKNNPKPFEQLVELIRPYKKENGQPDVLVPFSGGRDSTYTLHLVKEKLGLNPIAYTYDWGMVTDLARRNIARVCGKLGVENIIIAADIHWKRENIRKNIEAWLSKPHLGMIPLFMAGDKFFFYYANKVKKQNNIRLNIWGINNLENTDFKTGFAGIAPKFDKKKIYSLSTMKQIQLLGFVARQVCNNPGYLNHSVFDSLGSFASRYICPKTDYYHMFDYYRWDEDELETLILDEYKWEKSVDTNSTWRIGDGTASFYNYVYTIVAGFCENDTFRSNQIREKMISRKKALKLLEEENRPRFASIKWYLDIVGLNFEETIKAINKIPRLYDSIN